MDREIRYPKAMERQKYDKAFKEQAVRLSESSEKTVTQVAEELGMHVKMLYRWRREMTAGRGGKRAFPGHGRSRDEELATLRKKLREVELERDILKKAATYFAQHSK